VGHSVGHLDPTGDHLEVIGMYNDLAANKTIAHKGKKKKITVVKGEKEFKRWREFLIGEKFSVSTRYRYARSIADMINFLNKQPHNIKQNDIDIYKVELAKQYSRNSMTPPIAAINSFFANIMKKPNLRLKAPKKKIVNKVPLTYNEVMRLFDIAKDNPMDYAMITTLYYSQLRTSEICNLNLSDIDFRKGKIMVYDAKNDKDDIINLHPFAIKAIKEYLPFRLHPKDGTDPLFVSTYKRRISRGIPWKRVKYYAKLANIQKRVYTHLFRISSITHMAEGGATALEIQKQSRHNDLKTLMGYVQITDKHAQDIYLKTMRSPDDIEPVDDLSTSKQNNHVPSSERSKISDMPSTVSNSNNIQKDHLTIEQRKMLLMDKLLLGEISENTYSKLLQQIEALAKNSEQESGMYR
jgi:integrase/recombinase XerD